MCVKCILTGCALPCLRARETKQSSPSGLTMTLNKSTAWRLTQHHKQLLKPANSRPTCPPPQPPCITPMHMHKGKQGDRGEWGGQLQCSEELSSFSHLWVDVASEPQTSRRVLKQRPDHQHEGNRPHHVTTVVQSHVGRSLTTLTNVVVVSGHHLPIT